VTGVVAATASPPSSGSSRSTRRARVLSMPRHRSQACAASLGGGRRSRAAAGTAAAARCAAAAPEPRIAAPEAQAVYRGRPPRQAAAPCRGSPSADAQAGGNADGLLRAARHRARTCRRPIKSPQ
jgi:hypothetical protein